MPKIQHRCAAAAGPSTGVGASRMRIVPLSPCPPLSLSPNAAPASSKDGGGAQRRPIWVHRIRRTFVALRARRRRSRSCPAPEEAVLLLRISADPPKTDFCLFTQKNIASNVVMNPSPPSISASMLFRKRCNADGLDPKDCGGEGDCQWHSLIHELQVKGLGTFSIAQLRGKVADELEAQEPMDGFIVKDEFPSWTDYCEQVREAKYHTWGDNLILIAVCKIFCVQIRLTSISKSHDKVFTTQDGIFKAELHLGHIPEEHYYAMTPSSDPPQKVLNNNL